MPTAAWYHPLTTARRSPPRGDLRFRRRAQGVSPPLRRYRLDPHRSRSDRLFRYQPGGQAKGTLGATTCSSLRSQQAAIVAEYLAHGYVLGDHVIQRAIDFDRECSLPWPPLTVDKQGISNKFLDFFHSLDKNVGAKVVGEDKTVSGKLNEQAAAVVAKTREVDQSRGVTAKFSEYYNRVFGTGFGQK